MRGRQRQAVRDRNLSPKVRSPRRGPHRPVGVLLGLALLLLGGGARLFILLAGDLAEHDAQPFGKLCHAAKDSSTARHLSLFDDLQVAIALCLQCGIVRTIPVGFLGHTVLHAHRTLDERFHGVFGVAH